MFKKKEKTQKVTEAVIRSKSFELSLADMVKRSEKRAWFVASVSMVLVVISGIGVALILPLKQEVPYVVVADRDTGFSTVSRLEGDFKNNKITASEAINKSNVAQYVIARESYDWELTNINGWGKVLAMSDAKVATDYKNQFLEDFPQNPNKIYGRALSVRTKIRNITLAYTDGRQNTPTGATVNYDRYLFDKSKGSLQPLDRQMATQRSNRGALVRVALIGYTNVGKSTLMNLISKSEVFAENKLFATLDTTVRKVVIGNLPFLLSDTVGFIRKLPTQLIESFKSTLDEVRDADLLLHVVDISHPNFEEHIASVNQILGEIQSINKPTIMVFNKIDAYTHQTIDQDDLMTEKTSRHFTLEEWKQTWMSRMNGDAIFISAINKENIQEFREKVYKKVREIHITRFPYNNFLYPEVEIEEES